jgi:hypothetical protein
MDNDADDNDSHGDGNVGVGAGGELLRLGVDIGRVIIDGSSHPSGDDTAFFSGGMDEVLRTPPVDGVFAVLPALVARFGGRAWLISKCGERVQRRSLAWLEHHELYRRTGIPAGNVRFCRARPDKAIHCRELGITDFVDDRRDVLDALDGIVARRYLFGPQRRPAPPGVTPVPDWPAVAEALAPVLDRGRSPRSSSPRADLRRGGGGTAR